MPEPLHSSKLDTRHGALAFGFMGRQLWGFIADRIGGLRTVLAGSACQIVTMTGFLLTQACEAQKCECRVRAEAENRSSRYRRMPASHVARTPRQSPENQEGYGDDHNNREHCIDLHCVPPSEPSNRVSEHRRQHRASRGLAARDQRQGSAAPAIEPARDVDVKRRVNSGITEKPDKEPVAEIELDPSAEARQDEPRGNHHRPQR
jgi:hypothetical protein